MCVIGCYAASKAATLVFNVSTSAESSCTALINGDKPEGFTNAEWKETLQRNVAHLETIKAYKKEDGTTSIWTSENFTAQDAAVTAGKNKIAAL